MAPEAFAEYRSRGIYYFEGRVKCPLAGVGSRGPYQSNRLALDDAETVVTVDRRTGRITVRNEQSYEKKRIVADLLFLAEGTTARGERSPFGLHLKVFKAGRTFSTDFHRHLRTQEPFVAADFEPFEVVASDGRHERTLLTQESASALIHRPSLALRLVKAIMAMRNNLDGLRQDPAVPGFRLADLSVGFGALGLEFMVARAQLTSRAASNAPLIASGSVPDMLRNGAWEMKLTAQSTRWLPAVIQRDLFLFGLDQCPMLESVLKRGLEKNQSLSFRFERGAGEILLGDKSTPWPAALDTARAYVEFHMLGGLLAEQAASIAQPGS